MLRRAVRSLPGHVASSQRRGFLPSSYRTGMSAPSTSLPCRGRVRQRLPPAMRSPGFYNLGAANRNSDTPRLTLNSVEKGVLVASSELMTAGEFDSKSLRTPGRQRNLVDLRIWPHESRAIATVMRTNDKARWTWHSTWSFNVEAATPVSAQISKSLNEKNSPMINSLDKGQCLQYKGFIAKAIAAEFEVSMKTHFSVQQTLGRGAEGQVLKCVSKKGNHACAIKRYNPRKSVEQEPREVRVMKMLCHPNIKKLYVAWKEEKGGARLNKDSSVHLAQELCKGTFDDYLDMRRTKSSNEKLKIFKETVLGLRYLHDQGVVHRDIKSGNIFLDNQNHVKIGDFGSGAFIGSSSCCGGKFWGTAFYASHELWCLNAHTKKTDIFSLGVVYFELFGDFANMERRYRKLEALQKVLASRSWKKNPLKTWLKSNVSKGWHGKVDLLIRMLQTSPGRRPSCTDILLMLSSDKP